MSCARWAAVWLPSLSALSVCLWLTAGGASAPAGSLGGKLGRFASWECPSLAGQGCKGCCRLTAAMELVWGLVTASSSPWINIWDCHNKHRDTFTEVSGHCCTPRGWFAAALNNQGTSLSHRKEADTGRGLFRRGVLRLGQGEQNRKGSCMLQGIRWSSESRAGITGSPACQAMFIGRTEGDKRPMNEIIAQQLISELYLCC